MKTKIKLHFFLLLVLLSVPARMHAQGTAFTYNGRLSTNGGAVNGNYEFSFSVYDVAANGVPVAGPLAVPPVAVANGLFTTVIDFGPGVFTGPPRFLAISVRPVGGGAFALLTPRQELTSSPYSIHAASAGTAATVANGAVVKSLNNLHDNLTLAAGANVTITPNGNTLTLAAAGVGGSGIWSVNNNNAYYNAGNVGIGTTTPSNYGHGGTARILEINNSGTAVNSQAHLMLYSGVNSLLDSAIGTVTWAQPGGMGAYIAALTRSTTPNAPAAMLYFGTRKIGDGAASPKMVITENGNVGIGTTAPSGRLQVAGDWDGEQGALQLSGHRPTIRFTGDADSGNQSWLLHLGGDGPGALEFFRRTGPGAYSPVLAMNPNGNVGIGSTSPQAKLEVVGQDALRLVGYQPFLTILDSNAGYARSRIQGAGGEMLLVPESYLNGSDGNAYVKLANSGNLSVKSLTIRGGADVAEPFELTGKEIAKGSVVVIDDEHAGKLKLSTRAYDTQVAGIVSGANGVNPGISLHQQGALEGGQNVALSGRVYVLADAASGAIKPGDLLTTSSTPGHAMKVSDPTRSQGAILGKAMSALPEGKGMVLVLVTLQ